MRSTEPSELRNIRDALLRQAQDAGLGSGLSSRALAAAQGLDELLAQDPAKLTVLRLEPAELQVAVRLQSRRPDDRDWRHSMGARSRRLDVGEAASIAIAANRSQAFASDDEDALVLWHYLTGTSGLRTRDLLLQLADADFVSHDDTRYCYKLLQTDDLHNLGGPPW